MTRSTPPGALSSRPHRAAQIRSRRQLGQHLGLLDRRGYDVMGGEGDDGVGRAWRPGHDLDPAVS